MKERGCICVGCNEDWNVPRACSKTKDIQIYAVIFRSVLPSGHTLIAKVKN